MKFTPTSSTAASLGGAFGTGLSQPIDQAFNLLTQKKLSQIKTQAEFAKRRQEASMLKSGVNKLLGTDFDEDFLSSPTGQKLVSQLLGGELKREAIQEKYANQPTTIGEALFSNPLFGGSGNIERNKAPKTMLDRLRSSKPEQILSKEQLDMANKLGIEPEQMVELLMAEAQKEGQQSFGAVNPQQGMEDRDNSLLQKLTSAGVGAGGSALALSSPFLGQTIASAVPSGVNWLTDKLLGKRFLPEYEDLQKGTSEIRPEQLQAIEEGFRSPNYLARQGAAELSEMLPAALPPTAEQVVEKGKELSAGTPLEKYVVPQNKAQAQAELIGSLAGLAFRPSMVSGESLSTAAKSAAKESLKAVTKAIGAQAAGWTTKAYTGSEALGDAVTMGSLIASNLFPGSLKNLADKKYKQFDENVLKVAKEKGIKIDMNQYDKQIRAIEKEINHFPANSKARNLLDTQMNYARSLADGKGFVDPEALRKNIQRQSDAYPTKVKSIKKVWKDISDLQKDALTDLGKKIDPKSANALREADSLFISDKINEGTRKNITRQISPRNLGVGTMLFLSGLPYKLLVGAGLSGYAGKQMAGALQNPVFRQTFYDLAKAGLKNDAQLINMYSKKLDKQLDKIDPSFNKKLEQFRDKIK